MGVCAVPPGILSRPGACCEAPAARWGASVHTSKGLRLTGFTRAKGVLWGCAARRVRKVPGVWKSRKTISGPEGRLVRVGNQVKPDSESVGEAEAGGEGDDSRSPGAMELQRA